MTSEHMDRRRRIAQRLVEMAIAVLEEDMEDLPVVLQRGINDAGMGEK